ncbi:hypothetical protein ASPZODRAFT_2129621 [Penicilliopsis zonata CBS 506.65]|uniref:Major facilitator superfamily (MFS) profile domain-containing protein n=1 Tax=Penicilliopsis zonata CBS 506.65 TaxID=1073090 RepID=A0A1L9SH69_9EURO|nr:hypothetical protein ASPZODRAFT_2129621 [Penicilliopsis zonata CBS 506.65]OJJ46508.1 hypothetical protein ASPZODRAFT_2129621 [Penicilliopsis zonata CBS 506.65]
MTDTLLSNLRLYPKIACVAVALALAFLLAGYDTVVLGNITAVPEFKREFGTEYHGKSIIPTAWLSVWSAVGPIGSMAGAAAAGWLQDRAGRRPSLAASCVVCAVGIAVAFCANLAGSIASRRGVFLVGRTLQGVGVGGAMAGAQTYLSETVPVGLRGSALSLSPVFMLIGELVGAAVIDAAEGRGDTAAAYLIPFGSQWAFTALPFLVACLVPESPAYLLRRGQIEAARASLSRLHTTSVDITSMLEEIRLSLELEEQLALEVSYRDCFHGVNRRRTLIVCFAFVVPSFFGVPLLASASYFMQTLGMSSSLSILVLLLGIVLGLLANAVGVWLTSRIGRRPLMLVSLTLATLLWLSMGIAGCWPSTNAVTWYAAASMIAVVVVCGLGAWPASYAVAGEASSLRLRARTQGLGVLTYMLSNVVMDLVLPYIYNTDAGDLRAKTGFVYAGLCAVTAATTWLLVPEMKGRTAMEIDEMFEARLQCRQFGGHVAAKV